MADLEPRAEFSQRFEACQHELLSYILALVPRFEDALEVLQETAVALWQKNDQYDSSRPFPPWARRFAHVQVYKYYERQQYRDWMLRPFDENLIDELALEYERHSDVFQLRRDALRHCMSDMPTADFELLQNRYWREANLRDLAESLQLSENGVYRRLVRIRQRLEECIGRRIASEEA